MTKEWFKEWFDSPYYHILYQNRDEKEAQAFIKNLCRLLKFQETDHILDLACGKGRHSIYLNKKGYRVTGLDLSFENIAHAKKFENERLHFAVHDMRKVYGDQQYDFILNLFTSFGYFSSRHENLQVLNAVKQMLKPGGRLVIDFLNAIYTAKTLVADEDKTLDGITFHIHKRLQDHKFIKQVSFEDTGRKFSFEEQVQAFTLKDFRQMLSETGFEIIYTFGDYNLNPFREESSPRLILIASIK